MIWWHFKFKKNILRQDNINIPTYCWNYLKVTLVFPWTGPLVHSCALYLTLSPVRPVRPSCNSAKLSFFGCYSTITFLRQIGAATVLIFTCTSICNLSLQCIHKTMQNLRARTSHGTVTGRLQFFCHGALAGDQNAQINKWRNSKELNDHL